MEKENKREIQVSKKVSVRKKAGIVSWKEGLDDGGAWSKQGSGQMGVVRSTAPQRERWEPQKLPQTLHKLSENPS